MRHSRIESSFLLQLGQQFEEKFECRRASISSRDSCKGTFGCPWRCSVMHRHHAVHGGIAGAVQKHFEPVFQSLMQ